MTGEREREREGRKGGGYTGGSGNAQKNIPKM